MTEHRDIWDNLDPETEAWLKHCREELLPMIDGSAFTIQIVPNEPDPKIAVELGYSILLDKPIILVAPDDREIPRQLRKVADWIIPFDPENPKMVDQLTTALDSLKEQGLLPDQES